MSLGEVGNCEGDFCMLEMERYMGFWCVRGGVWETSMGELEWLQMAGTEEREIF